MTTELAKPEDKKEIKPPVNIEGGLVKLNNIDEAYRFSMAVVKSGLAPSSFRTAESVMVAIQMGAELGLKPMQALQAMAVINGKVALYGKGLPGVVLAKNVMEVFEEWIEGEGDNMVAICKVKRKGIQNERVSRFSAADAKKAGLWGSGNWAKYPKDMMAHKARSRAFTLFADVLCGLPVLEDIQDVPPARQNTEPRSQPSNDPLLKQITATVEPTEREMGDEDLSIPESSIPNA